MTEKKIVDSMQGEQKGIVQEVVVPLVVSGAGTALGNLASGALKKPKDK